MTNTFFELTNNEIKTALKDFKNYLQSKNNILKIDVSKADPLKENCYISSGSIAGVYFPNSIILLNDTIYNYYNIYNFVCIGKNENEETGFYLRLKEEYHKENGMPKGFLQEVAFLPFVHVSKEYFEIKNEIKKDINQLKKEIEILKTFKLTPKKDGTPQKNYRLNFEYIEKFLIDTQNPEETKQNFLYLGFTGSIYASFIIENYLYYIQFDPNPFFDSSSYITCQEVHRIKKDFMYKDYKNKLFCFTCYGGGYNINNLCWNIYSHDLNIEEATKQLYNYFMEEKYKTPNATDNTRRIAFLNPDKNTYNIKVLEKDF